MQWFPSTVDTRVRVAAWATFVVQTVIVVTGAAVRLTASGLGCPTWPQCTADSLVTTPEMGFHGAIEFANRLLTFVLVLVAIVTFVLILRMRKERKDLFWLTLLIGLGIPLQAVIGGISVLMKLDPYVVGLHFVASIVLVSLSTVLVYRVYRGNSAREWVVPARFGSIPQLAWIAAGFQLVTILLGILTTGSGPHAGDASAPRNGLNSELLQHLHSYPAYAAVVFTLLTLIVAAVKRVTPLIKAVIALLAINATQIAVGIVQSHLGLPEWLVATHMLLACLVTAATTLMILNLRRPVTA